MKSHKQTIRSLSMTALSLFLLASYANPVQAEEVAVQPDTGLIPTETETSPAPEAETVTSENLDVEPTETETAPAEEEATETSEAETSQAAEETSSSSNQETSSSDQGTSQTETSTKSETTDQATEAKSEADGPILPMPAGLVGTWSAFSPHGFGYTFTFNPDGSGSRIIHNDLGHTLSHFRIDKVQKVGENTYRFVAGENIYEISETGFGGTGVKYQPGFYLSGDTFAPIMWQTGINDNFDYTQGDRYKSPLVYIREVKEEKPQTPARQLAAPTSANTNNKKTLPQTGEASLGLLPIIGGLLLSIPVLKKYRR